jgi:protein involved in ribonucleotide reduction
MKLVYISLSGNIADFVSRVEMPSLELDYLNPTVEVDEDYIIISPTYDDMITDSFSEFIEHENNIKHLVGFAGSGNRNFDNSYCFNAKDLSKKYNKPLIFTFEFTGTDLDIINFKKEVANIEITRVTEEE